MRQIYDSVPKDDENPGRGTKSKIMKKRQQRADNAGDLNLLVALTSCNFPGCE